MALWLAVLGDTLVVRQVPVPPTTFQQVTGVASGIVSIVLCLVVLSIIPAALYLRAQVTRASTSLTKAQVDAAPLLREATALLTDLRAIASSARADAATIHQAVVDADAGIRGVRQRVESRLAEIDALIEVVQDEFEDVFVSTAAAARGVRAGAAALVQRPNGADPATRPATDRAEDDAVSAVDTGANTVRATTDLPVGVPHNGDDYTRHVRTGPGRPRIRSRRGEG
jgi:hypothetical protein